MHWIQADQDIEAEIAACGSKMMLEPWPDEVPEQVRLTLEAWGRHGGRLVIFDNAESPALIQEWMPKLGSCSLVLTSRRREWPADLGLSTLELDTLPRGESLDLLCKLARRLEDEDDKELGKLAQRLGDLPLALDLAGRYLNDRPGLSIEQYLAELDQAGNTIEHTSLLDWTTYNPTKHEASLGATFLISWEQLAGDEQELARQLFQAGGYCAPNIPIPREILTAGLEDDGEVEEVEVDRAIRDICHLGLFKPGGEAVTIHPLLAEFARSVDQGGEASRLEALVEGLGRLADSANRTGLPETFKPLRAHVRSAAAHAEAAKLEGAGRLWNELGSHLQDVAEYEPARDAYERALGIDEKVYGPDHPEVATDVNNLGSVLQAQGDLAGARDAFKRALGIDEKVYGPDHPDVARDVNNLGMVLQAQGNLTGPRDAFKRALGIFKQFLPAENPNIRLVQGNLESLKEEMKGKRDKG